MAVTLAVDAMGGDFGPRVTVPASLAVLAEHPALTIILVGQESLIRPLLAKAAPSLTSRIQIIHTDEVVTMDDKVAVALRNKRNSSMRLAINQVHEKKAAACVSAGNTSALMAVSRFVLKTHANIDRPAIMTALPTTKGHCHMLDLGANVDSGAVHLVQFAQMGSIVAEALDGIARPRVALLNIGEEEIKGNDLIKETHLLLKASPLNYIGYIEGDGIFRGEADVVVCDGFVGNISLKTTEGVARMFGEFVKQEIARNVFTRLAGVIALPIWKGWKQRMDPGRYNGASLVGLTGIVIKSHGSADIKSFAHAVRVALKEVEKDVPSLIAAGMSQVADIRPAAAEGAEMRWLAAFALWSVAASATALDRITEQDVRLFLDDQMTYTMRKDADKLMELFAPDFQWRNRDDKKTINRDEVKKIYTNNFLLAKMVLNSIDLREAVIAADGRSATVKYHSLTRYLIEIQNKKNVISRDEDFVGQLLLQNGRLVYQSLEKQ